MRIPVLTHRTPWNPPHGEELLYYRDAHRCDYSPSHGQGHCVVWVLGVLAVHSGAATRVWRSL